MVWLDLEGTVIDNLWDRNWLDDKIDAIAVWGSKFGVFTWGWFYHSEVDMEFIHLLEKKVQINEAMPKTCVKIITKKDCMEAMISCGKWFWDGKLDINAEMAFNEKFTKQDCFIQMFKHEDDSWLLDDSIEDTMSIHFKEYKTNLHLIKV